MHPVAGMLSTAPSQLSSIPLHTSAVGPAGTALQVVPVPLHTTVPVRWQAPTPFVQLAPVGRQVPEQSL